MVRRLALAFLCVSALALAAACGRSDKLQDVAPPAQSKTFADGGAGDGGPANACTDAAPQSCTYTFTDWDAWSACADGLQLRARRCQRSDGAAAECERCGTSCRELRLCGACDLPSHHFNVADPTQASCDQTLAGYREMCAALGCAWAGATACTVGGTPSCSCNGGAGACAAP